MPQPHVPVLPLLVQAWTNHFIIYPVKDILALQHIAKHAPGSLAVQRGERLLAGVAAWLHTLPGRSAEEAMVFAALESMVTRQPHHGARRGPASNPATDSKSGSPPRASRGVTEPQHDEAAMMEQDEAPEAPVKSRSQPQPKPQPKPQPTSKAQPPSASAPSAEREAMDIGSPPELERSQTTTPLSSSDSDDPNEQQIGSPPALERSETTSPVQESPWYKLCETFPLKPRVYAEQDQNSYQISIECPDCEHLDVTVHPSGNTLNLSGVVYPTSVREQQRILRQAESASIRLPHWQRRQLSGDDLLRHVCSGKYGQVDETVRLPKDAAIKRARKVHCRDGEMVIEVPRVRQPAPARRAPRFASPHGASFSRHGHQHPPSPYGPGSGYGGYGYAPSSFRGGPYVTAGGPAPFFW